MTKKHLLRLAVICIGSFAFSANALAHHSQVAGVITKRVGGFTFKLAGAENLTPQASAATQSIAVSKAFNEMATVNPGVSGYSVSLAVLEPSALAAESTDLNVTFQWLTPHAIWLVELTAPAQNGWADQWAVVAIDATTSRVLNSMWGGCAASIC